MTRRYSYDPEREFRGLESELERLKAQASLSWQSEARVMRRLGVRDGMKVLEVGCGPGFITRQLCELLPNSRITALDIDSALLARAREYLGDHLGDRVDFVSASVMATGLDSESFDLAISRYVFQHLAEPVLAAKEVRRLLKPGGSHLIIDIDDGLWGIVEPTFTQLRAIYAKYASSQEQLGGDRCVGRRLWRILRESGYSAVALDSFVYHSDEYGIEQFLPQMDPSRLLPLVMSKVISLEEYVLAQTLYHQFRQSEDAFVLMVGFIGTGVK